MKINKRIKRLATQILEIERDLQKGLNVEENQKKLENITATLSFEDMIIIDEYIESIHYNK